MIGSSFSKYSLTGPKRFDPSKIKTRTSKILLAAIVHSVLVPASCFQFEANSNHDATSIRQWSKTRARVLPSNIDEVLTIQARWLQQANTGIF
jgi:hypothetical protein